MPLQLRKRGRPRLDGSSELLLPATYLPLPKSVSNVPYSKDMSNICGNDHFNENQHQFGLNRNHQMLGHALGGALKPSQHYYAADSNHTFSTGHHTKKPLEHINGNITTIRKFCIVCKNISGPLVLCEDCDVRYHPFCGKPLDGKRHCPKCETHSSSGGAPTSNAKKEDASTVTVSCKDAAVTTPVPASTVTCSAQVTAATPTLHSISTERAGKGNFSTFAF
ncbi:hypothetical protein J437_LFUL006359 [Ladona fulva]|uniref:PHD-type domain-containing protein n=1 Tax=Ladona fulva TaxID=123851 RepID=A0A8K0K2H2_LADFU|nr:hypothetical protein J437_LFUL006359 [Ladona fulva]